MTFNWNLLFLLSAFMLVFALVFQSIPPLVGFLIPALEITHAQAGLLMSLFGLPGILISLPAGFAADAYGSRQVGLWALAISSAGSLLVALGPSFSLILAGRVIAGVGALTIAVVAPQALSQRFAKKDMGKVMGVFNSVMPLGTILALNTFGRLALLSNWRLPLLVAFAYSFLFSILFYFRYPAPLGEEGGKEQGPRGRKAPLRGIGAPVWLIAGIWLAYNAAAIAYLSFAGDYYVSLGHSQGYAGFLTSLLMMGSFLLSPLVGYLTDKLAGEEYFIFVGSFAVAFLFLFNTAHWVKPACFRNFNRYFCTFNPRTGFFAAAQFLTLSAFGGRLRPAFHIFERGDFSGPLFSGYFLRLDGKLPTGF